jgi:hypothetical protein
MALGYRRRLLGNPLYPVRFNDEMVLAAARPGRPAAAHARGRFDTPPKEGPVLAAAALLVAVVFMECGCG